MAQTLGSHDAGASTRVAGTAGPTRWQKVVGTLGLLVVVWVGSDLFDVVTSGGDPGGPGGHGPGGQAPPGEVTEDENPTPPSDQPHDPSQFNH